MKAYKGFNRDMTCRGFQFEEGKTYTHQGDVKLCESGFHACEDPLDCLRYYDPCTSVYHEVEIDDVSDERQDDTKIVGKKIRIGARMTIKSIVMASIEFAFASCKNMENSDYASGDWSRQAATGDGSSQAASGKWSRQAASGDESRQAASGDESRQETTGKSCVMMSAGNGGRAKGKIGSWIVLTEWEQGVPNVVARRIDGKEVKEDVWYTLKDGKFAEVES